ncbi:NAD(P)-dependent oxidoreductase [Deinococcus wulumuqiensis]|uniref:NAD(P)-dependent oxidoreductase n=1 Tax=Deinococcus wulumuqiensis TaxID=980427 RepID=UPI001F08814B|nr:NAD(P)-dependent oxidoreductase [Deinococcus wulumuqiensis]
MENRKHLFLEFQAEVNQHVAAGLDASLIEGIPAAQLSQPASRPPYSVLGSERGWLMPEFGAVLRQWAEATSHEDDTKNTSSNSLGSIRKSGSLVKAP